MRQDQSIIIPYELRTQCAELARRYMELFETRAALEPAANPRRKELWRTVGLTPWGVWYVGSNAPGGQAIQSISAEDVEWLDRAYNWMMRARHRLSVQIDALEWPVRKLAHAIRYSGACRHERRRWLHVTRGPDPISALAMRWRELTEGK